jgi:hypothetical protein
MTSARRLAAALAALSAVAVSCGSGDVGPSHPPDTTPPTIVSMNVSDGETDVGLIKAFQITFSEDMDASTITDSSVFVSGRSPRCFVDYDAESRTAVCVPETLYAEQTWHFFVVTDSVTDEAGNPLAADTTSFQTGASDCGHLADQLEPNSSIQDASPVRTDRLYHTLSICGDDDDYYSFTLPDTAATVTVRTSIRHADENGWNIHFMRGDGELYSTHGTVAETGHEVNVHHSFFPGTYYLRIYGSDHPVYVLYDLEIETGSACVEDEYEDNDFYDEAAPITPGMHTDLRGCYLDDDFYSFDVQAGQTVTLTATQHPDPTWAHSRMGIYDPYGGVTTQDSDAVSVTISRTTSHAGTCVVSAMFWNDMVYDLDIEVSD